MFDPEKYPCCQEKLVNYFIIAIHAGNENEEAIPSTSVGSEVLCNLYNLCCGLLNKNTEEVEKAKTELLSGMIG